MLIDELVAYARKIRDRTDLPAGTFDDLVVFVQEITEAARASQIRLLLRLFPNPIMKSQARKAAKPVLDSEPWLPLNIRLGAWNPSGSLLRQTKASRLCAAVCSSTARTKQHATTSAVNLAGCIRENAADFPAEAKEVDYYERMRSCYQFTRKSSTVSMKTGQPLRNSENARRFAPDGRSRP